MEAVRFVYNPHVLHLLYVKMRYLHFFVTRYYRYYTEEYNVVEDGKTHLLDYCIMNDWYAEILTRDLDLMQSQMKKEEFPLDLCYCHYEYFIFRLSQVFRAPGDAIDELYGGRRFECENNALKQMDKEEYRLSIQSLLRRYVEEFYFDPEDARKKSARRVGLLFNVKETLEKEVKENMIDQENMVFTIKYDSESTATLFYIHLIEELLCLHERKNASREVAEMTEYVFSKRRLFKEEATVVARRNESTGILHIDHISSMLTLFSNNLRQTFSSQLTGRIVYDTKTPQWSLASLIGGDTTETTSETKKKQARSLHAVNKEVYLPQPLDDTKTWEDSTVKVVGKSNFYGNGNKERTTLASIRYFMLSNDEDRVYYTHMLYRIAFELYMRDDHKCRSITTKTCYICEYCKSGTVNKKLTRFFLLCEEQIEDPESAYGRSTHLKKELVDIRIDHIPSLNQFCFKALSNVFCLFGTLPGNRERGAMINMIDPVKLLYKLSETVVLHKLEKRMFEISTLCLKKVMGLQEEEAVDDNVYIAREQALAMDVELVRLINEAVLDQMDELKRYSRSMSTRIITEDKVDLFCKEVVKVLHHIYIAHIDVLCQVIAMRNAVQLTCQ